MTTIILQIVDYSGGTIHTTVSFYQIKLTYGTNDFLHIFQRSDLHMQRLVDGQCPRLTESFAALCTLEGFLLGVDVPAKYNHTQTLEFFNFYDEIFSTKVEGVKNTLLLFSARGVSVLQLSNFSLV